MPLDLTVNEAAHIAAVPPACVERAIKTGVLTPRKCRGRVSGASARHLPLHAVGYLATTKDVELLADLPVARKKALLVLIARFADGGDAPVDLAPGLRLDLPRIAGPALEAARRYAEGKDRHITSDPAILGGVPVIRGTRIPVYVVRDRLADGDTVEELAEEYPGIPAEAFRVADIYARTHPERGRPAAKGRPWERAA